MRVESLKLEWIEALIDGDAAFTERFGIAVIGGWAGFPEALPHALDAARRHDANPWGSHLFFDDDGALVGFGGFKGPPIRGEVEIGYAVAPARQGRGLATTATRAMIDRARDRGATRVVAHTLATPNASTAVLLHCGFTRTATIPDPDDGVDDDVWRWELELGRPPQRPDPSDPRRNSPPADDEVVLRRVQDGDYEYVIGRLDAWWGGRHMVPMLPRLFFTHFDTTTIIAADPSSDLPIGFLCGFRSVTDPEIAYIHFVGVDPAARGRGVGRTMYGWFFERATALGCASVECVTSPMNTGSRAFHAAMGFGEEQVDDHDGNGESRVKFHRDLERAQVARPRSADYVQANMAFWNSRVAAHAASTDYGLARFAEDPTHLSDVVRFDQPRLGDISGLRGVHLQCHIGTDTVSLARLGATMTGLDLSAPALAVARRLARDAGAEIEFVQSHTFDALDVLQPGSFDLVYTGIGALNWLPDIRRWAAVVAGLLRSGGRFFMREGHPTLWALADARPDGLLSVEYPYFETEGVAFGGTGTYVETNEQLGFDWTVEFNHGLSEIMNALIDAGMVISGFDEHDSVPWVALADQMEPIGGGEFRLTDRPERLPHTYTLQARKL